MNKIIQDYNVGRNLRQLRKNSNLTQEQTAAKLQVLGCDTTRSTYSRYETGELNIKVSDLVALKQIFNCNYDDFFAGMDI